MKAKVCYFPLLFEDSFNEDYFPWHMAKNHDPLTQKQFRNKAKIDQLINYPQRTHNSQNSNAFRRQPLKKQENR